jgi:ribosomal protein S18 acetylase RimI-like enzyme
VRLTAGLTARPPEPGDAPAVFEVVAACETAVQGEADLQLEDIVADWARPSFDLAADAVAVVDGERIVAEAEVYRGRRADVNVHPAYQGRGIGAELLRWTEDRAREAGGTLVGQTVADDNAAAVALFRANGYGPMWTSWVLTYGRGDAPPPPPELPPGFAFRPFEPGRDDRGMYEVVEHAFGEWPDRDPVSFEDWRATSLGEAADPTLQLVIDHGGAIAGTANLADVGPEGWVHQLAVAREHRGLGLGRALLHEAFVRFHAAGKTAVGLSTDSRTGALGLYEHVGMTVKRSYTHHARQLRR